MSVLNTAVDTLLQPKTTNAEFFSFRDLPSRKQALNEGYLVDVSTLARSYKVPVAMTREVWELCIAVNDTNSFAKAYKEKNRAISILTQAKMAIKSAQAHLTEVSFEVKRFPRNTKAHLNKQHLWLVVSIGDQNEPVLTVMLDTQHAEALL